MAKFTIEDYTKAMYEAMKDVSARYMLFSLEEKEVALRACAKMCADYIEQNFGTDTWVKQRRLSSGIGVELDAEIIQELVNRDKEE